MRASPAPTVAPRPSGGAPPPASGRRGGIADVPPAAYPKSAAATSSGVAAAEEESGSNEESGLDEEIVTEVQAILTRWPLGPGQGEAQREAYVALRRRLDANLDLGYVIVSDHVRRLLGGSGTGRATQALSEPECLKLRYLVNFLVELPLDDPAELDEDDRAEIARDGILLWMLT